MAHNEAIIDIANALMQLERAFLKHDMRPPDTLRWSDIREAKRNMTILRSEAVKAPWSGGGGFRVDVGGDPIFEIAGFALE